MTASWTDELKSVGTSTTTYLLQENGFFLLLESGGKIVLTNSVTPITWTEEIKS